MTRLIALISTASLILLSSCGESSLAPSQDIAARSTAAEEHSPAMTQPDSQATLPLCLMPAGTIGVPDPVADPLPLPDQGNGLAADAVTNAPISLPRVAALRNDRQTFNRRYEFALDAGVIWFRSHAEITGIRQPWAKLSMPSCLAGTVIGISVDDDELTAIRADGSVYGMDNALKAAQLFNWTNRWGPPIWLGTGRQIPTGALAWSWSVISQAEDENWTDTAGNLHQVGTGKVSHIWLLRDGGQRFTFIDPWLPKDESYEMCGPHRGRFRAINLAASGSTIMTINRYGDIYTRHYDFDLAGDDSVFFQYSYEDQRGVSNPALQLPSYDWVQQPKVPGRITANVSIHKTGKNLIHRMMRVEGIDNSGSTGYWQRDIADSIASNWQFVATGEPLQKPLLKTGPQDQSSLTLGNSEDTYYQRDMNQLSSRSAHAHISGDTDWTGELLDFNAYCSPARLRVWIAPKKFFDLVLHSTDVIRQTERARGLDTNSRGFSGAIEIPDKLYQSLDKQPQKVQEFIQHYLANKKFTTVNISGVTGQISVDTFGWQFRTN